MTSPRTLLKAWNLSPNKALGQNFLTDPETTGAIVRRSGILPEDTVLEIGAGLGALTIPLANAGKKVYAVEKDSRMAQLLQTEMSLNNLSNVDIIAGNILALDIADRFKHVEGGIIVAGNLPYNISSQILIQLIEARNVIRRAVVMLQDELAMRVIEPPGSRTYGRISVMLQYCADIKKILHVKADRFFPKPNIDSAVLVIDFKKTLDFPAHDDAFLFKVIKAAFGQRRKTLKNALMGSELHLDAHYVATALEQAGIDPMRRAESLSVAEFVNLGNVMAGMSLPV